MTIAFLGLGSNQGDREAYLDRARRLLAVTPGITLRKSSGIYETEPVGVKNQPWFLNQVVSADTILGARALLNACKNIERVMGRTEGVRWGPRVIDVDLLLYGGEVIKESDLVVPHGEMYGRAFVLLPLAELSPNMVFPDGKKINDLIRQKFLEAVLPWHGAP